MKLYFMLGLPTETEEDMKEIAHLAEKVARRYYEIPKDQRNRDTAEEWDDFDLDELDDEEVAGFMEMNGVSEEAAECLRFVRNWR